MSVILSAVVLWFREVVLAWVIAPENGVKNAIYNHLTWFEGRVHTVLWSTCTGGQWSVLFNLTARSNESMTTSPI